MTPERAQEIWETRGPFGELDLQPGEREVVQRVWMGMTGNTCFADALLKIANGLVEPTRIRIGTAVFSNGAEILDQSPVYYGETADSLSVRERAIRAITMLGMPATDPVHGCNAKLAKLEHASVEFYPRGQ